MRVKMTTSGLYGLYAVILAVGLFTLPALDAATTEGQWQDPDSDLVLSWRFYPPRKEDGKAGPLPVAVLFPALNNGRWESPDEADRNRYLAEGMAVVSAQSRYSPPQELLTYVDALVRFQKALSLAMKDHPEWRTDPDQMYFIPATHRLLRDAIYWNSKEHGWPGTLNRILKTYNGHVVKKFGVKPANSPEDMLGPDGREIDYALRLDLIYPKQKFVAAPLLVDFGTRDPRMHAFSSSTRRMSYPLTFLLDGYAWAVVDHCWNPLARSANYGYWEQYSLQDWNGLAAATAAIRFFRAHAKEFHLDPDAIGVVGLSKGSYAAMRLADPENAKGREFFRFSKHREAPQPEQPWSGYSSRIQAAFLSMGLGVKRTQFLSPDSAPLLAAAGKTDPFGYWDRMADWEAACEKLGLDHPVMMMEDLGHTYPRGWSTKQKRPRLEIMLSFFNTHLHRKDKRP